MCGGKHVCIAARLNNVRRYEKVFKTIQFDVIYHFDIFSKRFLLFISHLFLMKMVDAVTEKEVVDVLLRLINTWKKVFLWYFVNKRRLAVTIMTVPSNI